jgi:hypothetical protein
MGKLQGLDELSAAVKKLREEQSLTVKDVAVKFGLRGVDKIIKVLEDFEDRGGSLSTLHETRLIRVLGMDRDLYNGLLQKRTAENKKRTEERHKYYHHCLLLILKHKDIILKTPVYYFTSNDNIFFSTAYINTQPLVLGELITHWEKGLFISNGLCCGRIYHFGAGGSPLSGINSFWGTCEKCGKFYGPGNITPKPFDERWSEKLRAHKNFHYPFPKPEYPADFDKMIKYLETL